jgi:hypothetical protein
MTIEEQERCNKIREESTTAIIKQMEQAIQLAEDFMHIAIPDDRVKVQMALAHRLFIGAFRVLQYVIDNADEQWKDNAQFYFNASQHRIIHMTNEIKSLINEKTERAERSIKIKQELQNER